MSRWHRYICSIIEYVLSQATDWLSTTEVATRVNEHCDAPALPVDRREIRNKLHSLRSAGKVHRNQEGRIYFWRWRP